MGETPLLLPLLPALPPSQNGWDLWQQASLARRAGSMYLSLHLPWHYNLMNGEIDRPRAHRGGGEGEGGDSRYMRIDVLFSSPPPSSLRPQSTTRRSSSTTTSAAAGRASGRALAARRSSLAARAPPSTRGRCGACCWATSRQA